MNPHHAHRNPVLRQIHARPRLTTSTVIGLLAAFFLPHAVAGHITTRLLLAWNIGAWLYLILAGIMMVRSCHDKMRLRAKVQDEGRVVVLILVIVATIASLAAIFAQLAAVKDMHGPLKLAHVGLAVLTIISAWLFVHLMFALHYAHDFYLALSRDNDGGLQFPGTALPDYGDFMYFSCIIGTSGQTADVSFTTKHMRRTGLVHCVLAYVFNTSVLALTINIASGLF